MHSSLLGERYSTVCCALTCVYAHVRTHVLFAYERLLTELTTERLDSKMALHVRAA